MADPGLCQGIRSLQDGSYLIDGQLVVVAEGLIKTVMIELECG
jgi:hypothetical protein